MPRNKAKTGKLKFSVDSSLLFQLGEQLVARPSIALAELVKNAYDADATKVSVTLENVGQPGGIIVLEDNGHGMTFEEIQSNWMRIATTSKRDKPVSRLYCRPLTGAKGIGRFAARRLGTQLTLQSTAERKDGAKESFTAEFDWEEKFVPGRDLTNIAVSYVRKTVPPDTQTGVSLLVTGTRDSWTKEEVINLKRDLLSLQSPFPDLVVKRGPTRARECEPDPGFEFELVVSGASDSEELRKLSGALGEEFLKAAWAKLNGWVDESGRAHYDITVLRAKERESLIDRTNDYSGLEKARFRIYYFVYKSEFFEEFDFGVREAQRKGREEGGVRIYLDSFRVFPYGDPGDDWLELDKYSSGNIDMAIAINPPDKVMEFARSIPGRPYLLIPKNNQLFGVVAISQTEHSNIEINVTRDRLLETSTVWQLQRFVQNGIYWMMLKYAAEVAEETAKRRKRRTQTVPEILEETKSAIEALATQSRIPEEKRQSILFNIGKAIEQAQEEAEEHISEIAMLRILASAGTTISLMNHQLQKLIGAVIQTEQDLLRLRSSVPRSLHQAYDDIVAQVTEWREMVELQVSQLGFLLAPENRLRRKHHALHQVVEDMRKPMSYYLMKYDIKFDNKVPVGLRTPPIYRSELYAILVNIFSNALKAVYGQSKREIAVEAERKNHATYIRMMDTGVGLPPSRREISFKPFVTKSIPDPLLGVGTGLGLKVVRDILELYDGTAHFIDIEEPWKTCIEIMLPERGSPNED